MTGLETTLAILACLFFASTCVLAFYAYKFGITILRVEDAVEECLDVLDERYASISQVLEIPLFEDSPQIRKVHRDIQKSRDQILVVANLLTGGVIEDDEEE